MQSIHRVIIQAWQLRRNIFLCASSKFHMSILMLQIALDLQQITTGKCSLRPSQLTPPRGLHHSRFLTNIFCVTWRIACVRIRAIFLIGRLCNIVWFANTSEDNAAIRPWCVYVGETQHIIDRTVQHVLTNQKNVPDRAEDLEIVADNEDAQSDAIVPIQHLKHYLDSEHKADQRITAAVQSDKTDVNQYYGSVISISLLLSISRIS